MPMPRRAKTCKMKSDNEIKYGSLKNIQMPWGIGRRVMETKTILAIDCGTQSLRALLFADREPPELENRHC